MDGVRAGVATVPSAPVPGLLDEDEPVDGGELACDGSDDPPVERTGAGVPTGDLPGPVAGVGQPVVADVSTVGPRYPLRGVRVAPGASLASRSSRA